MTPSDDQDVSRTLGERLRSGDESALEEVYVRYGSSVRSSLASRMGRGLQEADLDEIMSTALQRLWQARDRYDSNKASLGAWLYVLARNVALDRLRAAQRQRALGEPGERPNPLALKGLEGVSQQELKTALSALSTTDQEILAYYCETRGQGVWAKEIAERLGLRAGTVRVRRLRAVQKLAVELERVLGARGGRDRA